MKKPLIISTVVAAVALAAMAKESAPSVSATAALKDGSTVKGEFLTGKISGATIFDKNLQIDSAIVKSVAFTGTNGAAKVELTNGDRLAMTIANDAFTLRSLLGDLKVPRANFRTLSLSSRSASANAGSGEGLIFHCTFDDAKSITSPVTGPAGKFMTGNFQEGKVGNALMTVPYTRHAAFELPKGFLKDAGCVEFWAKILKQSPSVGEGGDPRLLVLSSADTHEFLCYIDIVSNDGGGNSGFSLNTWFGGKSSINGMSYLRYSDLFPLGNWRDWHHYALVWDKAGIAGLPGSPKAALLVDGKLVTSAGRGFEATNWVRTPSNIPHVIGITCDPAMDPERNTKSPFLIDEMKIWDYSKMEFDLQ